MAGWLAGYYNAISGARRVIGTDGIECMYVCS